MNTNKIELKLSKSELTEKLSLNPTKTISQYIKALELK